VIPRLLPLCCRLKLHTGIEAIMRSELVYEAGLKIENRFLLATTAMQATKKLHISSHRTEDTLNRVLAEVAKGSVSTPVP
jgi:hypothetical protein